MGFLRCNLENIFDLYGVVAPTYLVNLFAFANLLRI